MSYTACKYYIIEYIKIKHHLNRPTQAKISSNSKTKLCQINWFISQKHIDST